MGIGCFIRNGLGGEFRFRFLGLWREWGGGGKGGVIGEKERINEGKIDGEGRGGERGL